MYDLTLVLCTIRKDPRFKAMLPSLSSSFAALKAQRHAFRSGPRIPRIQFILVDGYQKRSTHTKDILETYFRAGHRKEIDFIYTSVKPSPWQGPERLTSTDYYDLCGARNTGIILAESNHVVLFDDCSLLGYQFLIRHLAAAKRGIALCGTFRSYTGCTVEDGILTDYQTQGGEDGRYTHTQGQFSRCPGNWMWGLNISFPLSYALKVNGYDEEYSGQGGSEDCDFGIRIQRAGCTVVFDPTCEITQLLDTHEEVCPPSTGKQKELQLKTGRVAYANEKLIERLIEDHRRFHPLHAHLNMKAARDEWRKTGKLPPKSDISVDWRDGQSLADM